jgi:hypothetical protein
VLGDELGLVFACLLGDPVGLALCFAEQFLALLSDPASFPDFLGDRCAHLVEDGASVLLVYAHVVAERAVFGASDELVELVDQLEEVHGRSGARYTRGLGAGVTVCTRSRLWSGWSVDAGRADRLERARRWVVCGRVAAGFGIRGRACDLA